MADGLDFGRRKRAPGRSIGGMTALLLIVLAVLLAKPLWGRLAPQGVLVEVTGEVPRPGLHRLESPTLAAAVAAAGGSSAGLPETPLHEGDRVVVAADGVHVAPGGNPLLVGLPVDVNHADAAALQALPGVGPSVAEAIVADRRARGPFYRVDDLTRVKGLGPAKVSGIAPFVTVGEPGEPPSPRPVDLNRASAAELEGLPGIGPVLASRIVVSRADRGPFASLEDLRRVEGVGPGLVARLAALRADGDLVVGSAQGGDDVGEDP